MRLLRARKKLKINMNVGTSHCDKEKLIGMKRKLVIITIIILALKYEHIHTTYKLKHKSVEFSLTLE